jgi:hypothetical protein
MVDLDTVWTLIVDGYDAELSNEGVVPTLETAVACASWATKFGTQDIGDDDIWCDAGRAYECLETADENGERPYCSGSLPSQDSYGVWALLRASSSEDAVTSTAMATMEDDWFGEGPEFIDGDIYCVEDLTFGEDGPWRGFDRGCNIEEAINCTEDGVPCTIDAALARRAFNSQVTPAGNLPSDPADWPRNVFIANESLAAASLEDILAGAGYLDDVDREPLSSVWQWFPALCAEKPSDSTLSYMDVCRWEFVGLTLMALTSEMEEDDFYNIKTNLDYGEYVNYNDFDDFDSYDEVLDWYYDVEDLEWYQTAFMSYADYDCLIASFSGGDMTDCQYKDDDYVDTWNINEAADQGYFERGFGVLGLKGSDEYSEFSKAVFGDEDTLTNDANLMFTFSDGDFQVLPVAALVWRYMQSYHSGLPSGHDVITGMWEPTEAEAAAGLTGPHDFCTFVSQVAAAVSMKEYGCAYAGYMVYYDEDHEDAGEPYYFEFYYNSDNEYYCAYDDEWGSTEAYGIPPINDGSLGWAAYQMTLAFGLETDEDYDVTCYGVEAWPAPEADSYVNLYMDVVLDTEADDGSYTIIDVPYHTSYSFFQEGDLKRAIMDLALPDTPRAERRAEYVFDGKYCIYWDNYEGWNPQPWSEGDCGLQALWLNDYYYECTYGDYADYYDCAFDYEAYGYEGGCLEYDEYYVCTEYECADGYGYYDIVMEQVYAEDGSAVLDESNNPTYAPAEDEYGYYMYDYTYVCEL